MYIFTDLSISSTFSVALTHPQPGLRIRIQVFWSDPDPSKTFVHWFYGTFIERPTLYWFSSLSVKVCTSDRTVRTFDSTRLSSGEEGAFTLYRNRIYPQEVQIYFRYIYCLIHVSILYHMYLKLVCIYNFVTFSVSFFLSSFFRFWPDL